MYKRQGRFFIARNENELLLRVVDSLGFRGKEPPRSSLEDRAQYRSHIEALLQAAKAGGAPEQVQLDAVFRQYRIIAEQAEGLSLIHIYTRISGKQLCRAHMGLGLRRTHYGN